MARAKAPKDPRLQGVLFVPLVVSVLIALALGAGVIVGAYWLVKEHLGIDRDPLTQAQAVTAAFATATAAGAVVALVVSVRKQGLSEQVARRELTSAFTERFRAAASQLGGTSPAERIAGVYAMAALADDYPTRAQQCVDVLCGYLRLPFDPESNTLASGSIDTTHTFADGKTVAIHRGIAARPFDEQVRGTIVTVVRDHLVPPPRSAVRVGGIAGRARPRRRDVGSWSHLDFNFAGAHLHNASFYEATFSGRTFFEGATFSGRTSFDGATFSVHTLFNGATFSGLASFSGATFPGIAFFRGASFSVGANFNSVRFSGLTSFSGATFSGLTSFEDATFSVGATFKDVSFSAFITFNGATFSSGATFDGAAFSAEQALFDQIEVEDAITFDDVRFENAKVSFDDLRPADGARITGLREPNLIGSATITSDGKPFRGWPPEDPEDSPTDVE